MPKHDAATAIAAAQAFLIAEDHRLATTPHDTPSPPPDLDLTAFRDASQSADTILLTIEEDYGPHHFDLPMFYFLMIATGLGAILRLNSRETGKPHGNGRHYVRLDILRQGETRLNVNVNRIVKNAQVGEIVEEDPRDYHNHLPEDLLKRGVPQDYRPSKNHITRKDVVEAILALFDKVGGEAVAPITRDNLAKLLWGLLASADAREADRAVLAAMSVEPWKTWGE